MLTHVPWPQSSSELELIQSSERCEQCTPYQPLAHKHLANDKTQEFYTKEQSITKNNCLNVTQHNIGCINSWNNTKGQDSVHKNLPMQPNLRQINSVHKFQSYSFNSHFNIILLFMPSVVSYIWVLLTKILCAFLIPHACYIHAYPITMKQVWWKNKQWISSLVIFFRLLLLPPSQIHILDLSPWINVSHLIWQIKFYTHTKQHLQIRFFIFTLFCFQIAQRKISWK
jgi:hypothetical protein